MNNTFKAVLKIFLRALIVIVILITAIFIFIQTDTFNKIALDYTLDKLNNGMLSDGSRIQVNSLKGNIFYGLVLEDGKITIKSDTLFSFENIDIKYDVLKLLDKQIFLDHLLIKSPDINLIKKIDSTGNFVWNFLNLFKTSEETDTITSPFDWDIAVSNFKIENGFIKTSTENTDTNAAGEITEKKLTEFTTGKLDITDLNLELNLKYFRDNKNLNLQRFSFRTDTDFNVKNLMFSANINYEDTITELSNFDFITDKSHISIDKLSINNLNPFQSNSFENFTNKKFECGINAEPVSFSELKYFIPDLQMLDSSASVSLKAKGYLNDFSISDLNIKLPNSHINIQGDIRNIDNPEFLFLKIHTTSFELLAKDIKTIYKDSLFPDYSFLGMIKADINFEGKLNNFFTDYKISSSAGLARGYLNLNSDEESYEGKIITTGFNLGGILKDKSLSSNLNFYGDFSGRGFLFKNINASLKYRIENSIFAGYDIRKSTGELKINKSNIGFNISHISSAGNISAKGKANISNLNNPVYDLKGKVSNLDISKLTKDIADISNLNFTFDINGSGSNLRNLNGGYNFETDNSHYAENNIPAMPLNILIANSGYTSKVSVASNFFEFNAEGKFNIEAITKAVNYNIKYLTDKFADILMVDSSNLKTGFDTSKRSSNFDETIINTDNTFSYSGADFNSDFNSDFNLEYKFEITDTVIASSILNPYGIIYDGIINGNISNDSKVFSFSAVSDINNFKFKDTVMILNNFKSDIFISNKYLISEESGDISSIDLNINANAGKISYQNSAYDSVKLNVNLSGSLADLNIKGSQDTGLSAFISGTIDMKEKNILAIFDSVNTKYKNIQVLNDSDWILKYIPGDKINFEKFSVKSKNLKLNLSGDYSIAGFSDLKLEGTNLSLEDLNSFIYRQDTSDILINKKYPLDGSINKILINYKGTLDDPELTTDITSGKLKYISTEEELAIGEVSIKAAYKNENADVDINFDNADNKGKLKIAGNIPVRNPLNTSDTLAETDFKGKSVGLKLTAKDFNFKYFMKLLPSLPGISGIMNGEISATGDAASPELKGNIKVDDGSIYYDLTGMTYKYTLNTSTDNSKLIIEKLSLSSSNDVQRHFDIFGNIDFSGMKINDIDLNTTGDMVFLDKDISMNELGVYGYFRAGSGSPGLKIKGNLDKLSITGQLLITDATISSVPLGSTGYENKVDNFIYINDSSQSNENDTAIVVESKDFYKINPFSRYKYTLSEKERTAADFLEMDIQVKTQKNIYVSIDFDNITKDRLFGELTADLKIKTVDNEFQAVGQVDIINNSYYRFYKDFKLKNSKISFNGLISNPVLDIQAIHEGVKTTEQFGTVESLPVEVMLTIKGELEAPVIELKLIEDGSVVSGTDAQSDAITFLLFGKYKSDLSTSERSAVASSLGTSLGSLYISSIVSQTVREILPFLMDAQFKYSQGNITDTDVELTSEIGDATIKVGGRLLKEIRNFEFVIDYPLNDFLNLNLPEILLLEFSREEENNEIFGSSETNTNTGLKIVYRIKY